MPSPKEIVRQQRRAKEVRRQRFLRARNVSARSTVRTFVRRAREAIEAGDTDAAEAAIRDAQSRLDSAARKGVIHRRKAARSVARLVRQLRAANAA
ncbi:MAG: 30S ribosomal protein S20 [Chloroflexota bacterium]|nr:30S ribosomal protein S20 [Chloroflexota bacterium]MDE2898662.1 30S ribosomal protein S20 [Chloroflexota bacterium]